MDVTIKTEPIEPIILTSIKTEPESEDEDSCPTVATEEDSCPPLATEIKSEPSNWSRRPCQKKRHLVGMKATQLWQQLRTDVVKFCQDRGLISTSMTCRCGQAMTFVSNKKTSDGAIWKCRKGKQHCVSVTIRKGSWFEKSHLKLTDILWIAYMWLHEYSIKSMLHESDNTLSTIMEWCTCCRDACRAILEHKRDPIGGGVNLVEIFECKTTEGKSSKKPKKKDSCKWVFIGLEQFSTKSVLVFADNKKSETILEIFDKYILPGTTVFGNTWNAFRLLKRKDFVYLKEEKSVCFYDAVNRADLNTVEDLWMAAERPPPSTNGHFKYEMSPQFCEYVYRKSLSFASDAYLAFLMDIAKICAPHNRMDHVDSILPD